MPLSRRLLSAACALALVLLPGATLAAEEPPATPVGMYGELRDLVLPGPELEPLPLTAQSEVVLRRIAVRPHGDGHRYDFDYYGLVAGEFNLCDYLQRVDGSDSSDLPPVTLRFEA